MNRSFDFSKCFKGIFPLRKCSITIIRLLNVITWNIRFFICLSFGLIYQDGAIPSRQCSIKDTCSIKKHFFMFSWLRFVAKDVNDWALQTAWSSNAFGCEVINRDHTKYILDVFWITILLSREENNNEKLHEKNVLMIVNYSTTFTQPFYAALSLCNGKLVVHLHL